MKVFEGTMQAAGMRFGVVVSRFNDLVTRRLLEGALDALERHGVAEDAVEVAWVPGAIEIPLVAKRMAESGRYQALIPLGAVIRGETSHYDVVCSMVSDGGARATLDSGVPITFGVLTTEDLEQALARAGSESGNKGFEAATGAIEMATLVRGLEG
ncbi:MAG: 6,7-dimethyl-8-ribityllumazine synthase [Deinococcales bacterium]